MTTHDRLRALLEEHKDAILDAEVRGALDGDRRCIAMVNERRGHPEIEKRLHLQREKQADEISKG